MAIASLSDLSEKKCIYRNVDVRALAHFHEGAAGLSVAAERIWCRLLIDDVSTPVPGLVLARRGDMIDRCRMSSKQFAEAFRELENAVDECGSPAPMALANWPIGVIILPGAPRQLCHKPQSTSTPVAWRKFIEQSAPRCQEVSSLVAAWEQALLVYGAAFADAFRSGSRGTYKKPMISDGASDSAKCSPNGSSNASSSRSQETGDRRQETGERDLAPPDGVAPSLLHLQEQPAQEPKPKKQPKPKAPKAVKLEPDPEPMPFTIREMLAALDGASPKLLVKPYDPAYSKPLTAAIRAAGSLGYGMEDIRLAAEYAKVGGLNWAAEPLQVNWLSKAGSLTTLLGRVRAWRDRGKPPIAQQGASQGGSGAGSSGPGYKSPETLAAEASSRRVQQMAREAEERRRNMTPAEEAEEAKAAAALRDGSWMRIGRAAVAAGGEDETAEAEEGESL